MPLSKLKPIARAFTDEPPLPAATLKLLKFCSDYYHYPLGQTLLGVLPPRLREGEPAGLPQRVGYRLTPEGHAVGLEAIPSRAALQRKLFSALQASTVLEAMQLAVIAPGWRPALKPLMEKGWVESTEITVTSPGQITPSLTAQTLNSDQQQALDAMLQAGPGFQTWLLYGITGSGKTEVYMHLLQAMLQTPGSQALVLVPEINLTPQLESRFRARFPNQPIVMLHSQMNESERLHGWLRAQNGEARIVIGTRLSVFTPLKHPAVIIVDEEHDSSYKQQDGMRYSARDIAIIRGKMANVPVVLGSATPSLESWHNAQEGRYRLLTLSQRAVESAALPDIHAIDTRIVRPEDGISESLFKALEKRLERGEQSLLFINRRGYSPVLLCSACAWVAPCTRCSAGWLVQRRLRCHHCGHEHASRRSVPVAATPTCTRPGTAPSGWKRSGGACRTARILRVDHDRRRAPSRR